MNRFRLGRVRASPPAAVVLSGCGAGQVSQTATQEPAVNGTSGTVGTVALRNIHLRAAQTTDYVQPGRDVELIFAPSTTRLTSTTSWSRSPPTSARCR